MPTRRILAALAALFVLSLCAAHGGHSRVLVGGSGDSVLLAIGDSVYRPLGDGQMEPLLDLGRTPISALTASPDGLFVAAGRALYGGNLDGSGMRPMGNAPHPVTALASSNGTLYAASDDVIYQTPVHADAKPTVHGKAPGGIRALYASPDGLYVAVGKNLWRLKAAARDLVAEAPAPIMAVTGGNRNVYYAYRSGSTVEVASPGSDARWAVSGLKEVDGLYLDAGHGVLHYGWADKKGPHHGELHLGAP